MRVIRRDATQKDALRGAVQRGKVRETKLAVSREEGRGRGRGRGGGCGEGITWGELEERDGGGAACESDEMAEGQEEVVMGEGVEARRGAATLLPPPLLFTTFWSPSLLSCLW